ncbi:helix-turn-helix domain-containing protein [Zhihengliuella halotolerans]|uniref:helix-turn-helix domain-containing protein n=1 Tax=Zhihengliuella halotolerans TaxID=370736 RepID=UPI0011AF5C58|nr:helix-turn-helix domain-containing protein [Zhihengliuella halotolerans]
MEDVMLTIPDVAEMTNTSPATVRRWISQGELRAFRYGKRMVRIDPADLRRMRRQIAASTFEAMGGGAAA